MCDEGATRAHARSPVGACVSHHRINPFVQEPRYYDYSSDNPYGMVPVWNTENIQWHWHKFRGFDFTPAREEFGPGSHFDPALYDDRGQMREFARRAKHHERKLETWVDEIEAFEKEPSAEMGRILAQEIAPYFYFVSRESDLDVPRWNLAPSQTKGFSVIKVSSQVSVIPPTG